MALRIDVVTLFPAFINEAVRYGVTARGLKRGLWSLSCWNPRDFATDNHRSVDDRPYGGGPGMVMLAEPLKDALEAAKSAQGEAGVQPRVIYLSPQGRKLDHARVVELAVQTGLVLLAGRYEGVDERLLERHIDEEISIGDFVLSGGELPALVLMDAVVRQLPGILNAEESAVQDSFVDGLLDHQHYTRPEIYEGQPVPKVLLSGNHAEIARWRRKQALGRTWQRNPQLLEKRSLSQEDLALLAEYKREVRANSNQV